MDSHLNRLFDHLEWANDQVLEVLEAAEAPVPEAALTVFGHLLGAEQVWLSRIQGKASPKPAVWPSLSVAQARAQAEANLAGFRAVLETATGPVLARVVEYKNTKGEAFWTPLRDILFHVVLHGAYHRGQVAMSLRQGGLVPASTDFITFARSEADRGLYHYLEVPAGDLIEALEGSDLDLGWCLNLTTGAVDLVTGEDLEEDDEGEEEEAEDHLMPIEALPSNERFVIMEDFVETLPEGEPARALARALRLPKPFRCFKDTLRDFKGMEQDWYAFKDAAMRKQAEEWLRWNVPGARLLQDRART